MTKLIRLFNLSCLISSFFVCVTAFASTDKPNIIIFLVDDMGLMDTSVPFLTDKAGIPQTYPLNHWYKTPNMQRLAEMGTRYSTFYAQSVCSPSRASLLTGQNATRHKTTQWIKPSENNRGDFGPVNWNWTGLKKSDISTLPHVLKDNGYKTIFVGKGHFAPVGYDGANPLNLGFDVNIGGAAFGSPGSYYGEDHYRRKKVNKEGMFYQVPHLEKYHNTNTHLSEALTLEAKHEIRQAVKSNKPFFLELSHYAVHGPLMSDPRFIQHYQTSQYSKKAQIFASMVEGMDKSLGDILDELERLQIAENTLILFLGDNGSDAPLNEANVYHSVASSAPLRGKKGTHYEGGMRIPFIAAWAKPDINNKWQQKLPIKANAINQQLGNIMDVYPTVLDLLGISVPERHVLDGFSLARSLRGEDDPLKPPVFLMHFPHEHRSNYFTSYRHGNWKLIYHYFPEKSVSNTQYELFNLANDPTESINLKATNHSKLKEMFMLMTRQLDAEGALYPIKANGEQLRPEWKL